MIRRLSNFIESKTGVYLYPRSIILIIVLLFTLLCFGLTLFVVGLYRESVRTVGPEAGTPAVEYEARMRAGVRPPSAVQ